MAVVSRATMDDEQIPELAQGFVRLAVLLEAPEQATPGAIARSSGVELDDLGPVLVLDGQALIDVRQEQSETARRALEALGPTQVVAHSRIVHDWHWLRIQIGRNHGLTIGQLGKILTRAQVGPIGRIHIQNTHTLIGLRDDYIDAAESRLADTRINGAATRPSRPRPDEIRESAAFIPQRRR